MFLQLTRFVLSSMLVASAYRRPEETELRNLDVGMTSPLNDLIKQGFSPLRWQSQPFVIAPIQFGK